MEGSVMFKLSFGFAVGLMAVLLAPAPAGAIQSKCLSSKTKCASKKAFALFKCQWKAETPGKPADPNAGGCVDNAQEKFDGGDTPELGCFQKLESNAQNDCVTADDTVSVEGLVDQCVTSVVSTIDPMVINQTKCAVGKFKCAAKKLKKALKCYAKAETPGKPSDPNTDACLDKVQAKFDGGADSEKGCVVKLEASPRSDCVAPTDNQAAIGTAVDDCVDSIVTALETASTTTTTTSSTTSSSALGTTTTSTPTGSTTTTSTPSSVNCSANGLRVTVSIAYNEQTLSLSGIHLGLNYPTPLGIPGSAADTTVRQRVTNLAGTGSSINGWNDHDTNANGVDDVIELNSTRSSAQLGPGQIFRVRFDCPSGTPIAASSLGCFHSGATDASGSPISPTVEAAEVSCSFVLAPEP
jgi:hypothetical protein